MRSNRSGPRRGVRSAPESAVAVKRGLGRTASLAHPLTERLQQRRLRRHRTDRASIWVHRLLQVLGKQSRSGDDVHPIPAAISTAAASREVIPEPRDSKRIRPVDAHLRALPSVRSTQRIEGADALISSSSHSGTNTLRSPRAACRMARCEAPRRHRASWLTAASLT